MARKLKTCSWAAGMIALAIVFMNVLHTWEERPAPSKGQGLPSDVFSHRPHEKLDLGDMFIEGPHMTGWGANGKPLWEVWAQRIEYSQGRKLVRLIQARGNYYERGSTASMFRAGLIQVNITKSDRTLHMTDQVIAHWASRDVTLKSRTLDWHFDRKRLVGQERVQFIKDRWRFTGQEVIADLSMQRVKITGGARLETVG